MYVHKYTRTEKFVNWIIDLLSNWVERRVNADFDRQEAQDL